MYPEEKPMTLTRGIVLVVLLGIMCAALYYNAKEGLPQREDQASPATASTSDWTHPEQQPGEVFIGNTQLAGFVRCNWPNKRLGTVAYNTDGKVIGQVSPEMRDRLLAEAKKNPGRFWQSELWRGSRLTPFTRRSKRVIIEDKEVDAASLTYLPFFTKRDEVIKAGLDPDSFQK